MTMDLSGNTQAILLLTAPLVVGGSARSPGALEPLAPSAYRQLARFLRDAGREPAALLEREADDLVRECAARLDPERIKRLLARGVLLAQAVERWQARHIWVVSRADPDYPQRLKKHLGVKAPPVLYGCGVRALLDTGGLAVVGSRNVDVELIDYTEQVGRLAAAAERSVISGGARGIDRAAMSGSLDAGGSAVGVLADSLERAVVRREYRDSLSDGRLVLSSPYDPSVGFKPWRAMGRNKLIYALADAALVENTDYEKGGTWAGATEQLGNLSRTPIYVRDNACGEPNRGLAALLARGALPWPEPRVREDLVGILDASQGAERLDRGSAPPVPDTSTTAAVGEGKRLPEHAVRTQGSLNF